MDVAESCGKAGKREKTRGTNKQDEKRMYGELALGRMDLWAIAILGRNRPIYC